MIVPDIVWLQNARALRNRIARVLEDQSAQRAVMEKYADAVKGSDAQVQTRKASQRLKKRAKGEKPQAGACDHDE